MRIKIAAIVVLGTLAGAVLRYRSSPSPESVPPKAEPAASAPAQRADVQAAPVTAPKLPQTNLPETASVTPFEATPAQAASLEEARKDSDDWERQRSSFLTNDLKLSESEMAQLEKLRLDAESGEKTLMETQTQSESEETKIRENLSANRARYEERVRALVGGERWKRLVAFHQGHFNSTSSGLHLPLK